jgi:GntR family transcriptional regulator, transcriptional repressor for pyruvate dehydrogenase complex
MHAMNEERPLQPSRQSFHPANSNSVAVAKVIAHVRGLIERGELRPGDRLPPERELATQLGLSRPTVRTGLRSLSTMGAVQSRQGSGTFITAGPPSLASEPLDLLAALHGLTRDGLFEARRVLEVGTSALAADRASGEDLAAMSEEVTGMYASIGEPTAFLLHDVRFHRAIAAASKNPVLGVLIDMLGSLFYERRRETIQTATDLRETADAHRKIYQAVRARDREAASAAMGEHLRVAQASQTSEGAAPAMSRPAPSQ